jgi:hypothetical protein
MGVDQYLPDIDFIRLAKGQLPDEPAPLAHEARRRANGLSADTPDSMYGPLNPPVWRT